MPSATRLSMCSLSTYTRLVPARVICWSFLSVYAAQTLVASQANSASVADLLEQARAALRGHHYEETVALYHRAMELDPRDASVHVELGQLYEFMNQPVEAIVAFRGALDADPQNETAELGLSDAYRQVFNRSEARRVLEEAARRHPQSAGPLVRLGEMDIESQGYDDALKRLRQALRLSPSDATARIDLATVYQARGQMDQALRELNLAIKQSPRAAAAFYLRASIYADRNDDAHALEDARKVIELQPDNQRGRALLAKVDIRVHECAEAVALLEPEAERADAETLYLLARAYECDGQPDPARKTMAQFAERSESEHSSQQNKMQADYLAARAGEMARKNQLTAALGLLNQALAKDPESGKANAQLAKIYYSQGEVSKAREAVARALKTTPYQPDYLYVLGRVLEQQGDLPGALSTFEKTVEVDPRESDAYYEMGMAYLKTNDRARGLEALKRAVQLAPDDADYRAALQKAEGTRQ